MSTDKNLQFITEKILETNIALMYCHTDSLLKLPNSIVETHRVDENGFIWVFVARPKQFVSQLEKEFATNLNYFKKGSSYSMKIFGKARILSDAEELTCMQLTSSEIERALNSQLLICVKILKADYFDYGNEKSNNFFSKAKSFFYSLLDWAEPDGRSFEFNPTAGLPRYGF